MLHLPRPPLISVTWYLVGHTLFGVDTALSRLWHEGIREIVMVAMQNQPGKSTPRLRLSVPQNKVRNYMSAPLPDSNAELDVTR